MKQSKPFVSKTADLPVYDTPASCGRMRAETLLTASKQSQEMADLAQKVLVPDREAVVYDSFSGQW